MSRRLPRSFFWIDQQIIRSGAWLKLSPQSRLIYIAVSASVDKEGLSIWSPTKLMELSGCRDRDEFQNGLIELETHKLVVPIPQHVPPAIQLCSLQPTDQPIATGVLGGRSQQATAPIIVHTTVHIGGGSRHVESGDSN